MANLGFNRRLAFDEWAKGSGALPEECKRVKERVQPIVSDSSGDVYQETTLDRALETVRVEIHQGGEVPQSPNEVSRTVAMLVEAMRQDREERKQQHQEQSNHLATVTSMVAANVRRRPNSDEMTTTDAGAALSCGSANVLRMLAEGEIPSRLLVEGTDKKGRQRKFKRKDFEAWLPGYLKEKAARKARNSVASPSRRKKASTKRKS